MRLISSVFENICSIYSNLYLAYKRATAQCYRMLLMLVRLLEK